MRVIVGIKPVPDTETKIKVGPDGFSIDPAAVTKWIISPFDEYALEAALNLYKLDNYVYPTTDQGLEALVEKPSSPEPPNWKAGGYLDRLPKDPWNQDYLFLSPGEHGSIDIFSMGVDQQPSDDDIGNWGLQ